MVYATLLKLAIKEGKWGILEDDYLGWEETRIEYVEKCEGEIEYNGVSSFWISLTGTPNFDNEGVTYKAKVKYKNVPEFTVELEQDFNYIFNNGSGKAVDSLELWISNRVDEYLRKKGVNEEADITLSDFWRENERRIRTGIRSSLDRDSDWIETPDFLAIKKCSGKVSLGEDFGHIKYTVKFNNFDDPDYLDYDLNLDHPTYDLINIPFELPEDLKDDGKGQEEEIAKFVLEEIYNYLQDFVFSDEVEESYELDEAGDLKISKDDVKKAIKKGEHSSKFPQIMLSSFVKKDDDYIAINIYPDEDENEIFTDPDYFMDRDTFSLAYTFTVNANNVNRQERFTVEGNKLGELEDDEFAELVADLVWETYKLVSQGEIGSKKFSKA